MKVGIMTWFYGSNYGAKAQSYALQKVVESFGIDTYMIDYRHENWKRINKTMNLDYPHIKLHPLRYYGCIKRNTKLSNTDYLYNLTKKVRNPKDIDSLNMDVIIFGSDAIFNTSHPFYNSIYMGVSVSTNKITYSPSCEYLSPNTSLQNNEVESLKDFKSISVRDINTQNLLINNSLKKPVITCDPTILYDFTEISTNWAYRNYVLVYSFSEWNEYSHEMKKFAKEHNLKIISIGRYCKWADISIEDASFEQWVVSFKYADYVFTDSFHGTVFALKNNKKIILVSRNDKKAKIESLLTDVCIKTSFLKQGEEVDSYITDNPINYSIVNDKLNALRVRSLDYLKNALKL